jgi:hypothetical protein
MTKPVLLIDFEGTLCYDRFWKSLDPQTFKDIQNFLFIENPNIVKDWMCGRYTSEEINQLAAQKLDIDYETLWKTFITDCETVSISPVALELLLELKNKYIKHRRSLIRP